jgi:hypothetical protein
MDITKCSDDTCPLKDICYRFTSKADLEMQAYFMDSPRDQDKCEMFMGRASDYYYNP